MLLRKQRGAAAVEFTLLLPVFMLIILGILEMGLLMKDALGCSHAAREACRLASVMPAFDLSQIQQKAINTAGGIPLTASNITVKYFDDSTSSWTPVASGAPVPSGAPGMVQVRYDHPPLTGVIFPGRTGKTVTGSMIMRRE